MNNRAFAAVGLVVALVVGISFFMPDAAKPINVGDQAKPITLPTLQGEIQGLPKGKVVLLNFWATWCPPCRKEVPSMVKLYAQLKDKGFEIVAVSVDRSKSDLVSFVQEYGMNFTVLHDIDSTASYDYGVFRYPETFIIDRKGVIRQHLNGEVDWALPEYTEYFEKLLVEPVSEKTMQPAKL